MAASVKYGSRKVIIVSRNEPGPRAMGQSGVLASVESDAKNIT
jgi:hypothetical protein